MPKAPKAVVKDSWEDEELEEVKESWEDELEEKPSMFILHYFN